MVDWSSSTVLAENAASFSSFMHALLGLYLWEWFTTLDFDIIFLLRKRRFRWPLTFYFLCRYCMLAAMIGLVVSLNVTTEINCQSLYIFNQLVGNFTIGLSSINLALRSIAVWDQAPKVIIPLVIIILGHWAILLRSIVLVKAEWVAGSGCIVTSTNNTWLIAIYLYTISLDGIVTALLAWKLMLPAVQGHSKSNRLTEMVFGDGLIYFVLAFLANMLAVVFVFLDLNAVMSVIAEVPAAVVSTIVSCRVVRRLTNYASGKQGAEMFTSDAPSSTIHFSGRGGDRRLDISNVKHPRPYGVSVQMHTETFHSADDPTLGTNTMAATTTATGSTAPRQTSTRTKYTTGSLETDSNKSQYELDDLKGSGIANVQVVRYDVDGRQMKYEDEDEEGGGVKELKDPISDEFRKR